MTQETYRKDTINSIKRLVNRLLESYLIGSNTWRLTKML
jgi:hypothetical protein